MPERRPLGPIIAATVLTVLALGLAASTGFALTGRIGSEPQARAQAATPHVADGHSKKHRKTRAENRKARTSIARSERDDSAADRVEPASSAGGITTVTCTKKTPQRLVIHGSGPIESIVRPGSPGLRRLTLDAVTHEVLDSHTLRSSSPTVVRRRTASGGKVVALTFDDGPHPTQTPQILAILRREHVKATFFMVGRMARYHPQAARAVARAGMLIGDHTENHVELPNMSDARVRREITRGQASIRAVTGVTTHWFRSPYGKANAQALSTAGKLGMKVVTWDVDTSDWQNPSPKTITRYAEKHVRPGSIVLLHDGGGSNRRSTVEALPGIIRELKKRGYRFVTLDQL